LLREAVPYAVFVHDVETRRVRFLNSRFAEMVGQEDADVTCDQMRSWVHPEDLTAHDAAWGRCGEVGVESLESEQRVRHADGSWRWLLTRLDLVDRHGDGRPARFLGTALDITHRRVRETKQTESQKLDVVSRLAGSVAHDFNNSLTVILSNVAMVLEKGCVDAALRGPLEEVIEVAQHAAILTRQLLSFAHKEVVRPEPVCPNEIVDAIRRLLRRLLPERVMLTVACDPEAGRVVIDPAQLALVVLALVNNARDALTDVGSVAVRTSRRAGRLEDASGGAGREAPFCVLVVSDTGGGMDQGTVARMFDLFFSTKTDRGSGLGLTTVLGIVKAAGGDIRVRSEPGDGTDVEVWLPEVEAAARITSPLERPPATRLARRPSKVLLVEDDPLVAKVTRNLLAGAGYEVLRANDGEEGLTVFASHEGEIDLVVSDVVMPRLSGVEMAVRLRSRRPSLPVVLMSGYTQDELQRPHGLGQVVFVAKPFTAATLLRGIEKAMTG
jgi:PAS domain S-box-containing protein